MSLKRTGHLALALTLASLSGLANVSAAAPSPGPAHDATHPYVMQQAAREVATAKVSGLQPSTGAPRLMPAVGGGGGPLREIFGFALASSLGDANYGYPSWNFSLLSTVAFFGLHVNDDGSFANDSGMAVWNSGTLSNFVTTAHQNGTKVVLTIIEQDFSPGTPHMCAALGNAARTVTNAVNEMKAKGVDGINLDYEGLNGSCGTPDPSSARHMMSNFSGMVRAGMPAGSYLSVDTYASSATDSVGFFDVATLANNVDSFFVMAYDLEYSNAGRAPTNCSSFCLGPTAPLSGYYYTDTSTTSQYLSVVAASKVILGVPYYGRKSCVASGTANQYPTGGVTADTYLDAVGESTDPQVQPGTYSTHRDANDPAGQERWDTWLNPSLNCTRELYWDDTTSLAQKYDLVNRSNLRGVGIWNLNYGGGAAELWGTLNTYFACPVAINVAAGQSTTQFKVGLSSGSCKAGSFDLQVFDSTYNQGWFTLPSVAATSAAATATLDGFINHTYQIQARARNTSGVAGPWANGQTTIASNATKSHPWSGLYVVDAYGGVNADDSPPQAFTGYWPGWRIARTGHEQPSPNAPQAGIVMDGWGGMHPFGAGIKSVNSPAYWNGWDIARDFAWLPNGTGGFVLDGYGGLHAFSINGAPLPPPAQGGPYWGGWDIARKVVIFSDGTGGYVLDGFGGVHSFGIGQPNPQGTNIGAYWNGWDIARGLVLIPGTRSGYVLDGFGGVTGFAPVGQNRPPGFPGASYWSGWDVARGIWMLPSATLAAPVGYTMDAYGGVHPLGAVPPIVRATYFSSNIAVGLFGA